jgi:broad specificity phosphatase PhoE
VLILVRHGRTALNATGRLVGRLDPPLDAVGQRQAAAVGRALAGVDRVVTSPLRRARQTAEQISDAVVVDGRWIEVDYGDYDGLEIGGGGEPLWEKWRLQPDYVPPGGESLAEMVTRVVGACDELLDVARDHDVAVVSHVSPIKAVVAWVLGAGVETAWRSHLDQGGISRVAVTARGPVLRSFNETWHLAGL